MPFKVPQLLMTLAALSFTSFSSAQSYDRERIQNMLSPPKILQTRKHIVSVEFNNQNYKYTSNSLKEEIQTQSYGFGYGQNFRRFETGIRLLQINADNEQLDTQSSSLKTEVYGRFNIIQNIPEEFFIPYVEIGIGQLTGFKNSSSSKLGGSFSQVALGMDWYPFREYIALGFELKSESNNLNLSGSSSGAAEIVQTGFRLNYRLVF